MDEITLIKECIRPNIPNNWRREFEMQGGKDKRTFVDTERVLRRIEKWEVKDTPKILKDPPSRNKEPFKKKAGEKEKGKAKGEPKANPSIKNPCKLKNHQNHDWKDCFNNPSSKSFKGKTRNWKEEKNTEEVKRGETEEDEESQDSFEEFLRIEDMDLCGECKEEAKFSSSTKTNQKAKSAEILISLPEINKEGRSTRFKTYYALLDTGSSASLANERIMKEHVLPKSCRQSNDKWLTQCGEFVTNKVAELEQVKLPQFSIKRGFKASFHFFQKKEDDRYDFIIGRDIQQELGIDIINSETKFRWDGIEIEMSPRGFWTESKVSKFLHNVKENLRAKVSPKLSSSFKENKGAFQDISREEECKNIHKKKPQLKPAEYIKPDLNEIAAEQLHLTAEQRETLRKLLHKHSRVFQGTKGQWKGEPVHLELQPDAKPFCAKPFRIPHSLNKLMKEEVERLVKIGVLKRITESEWAAPSFGVPKKGDEIRVVSDFRGLNERLVRKPHPLPRIEDTMSSIGGIRICNMSRSEHGILEHGSRRSKSKALCHRTTMGFIPIFGLTNGFSTIS